MIKQLLEQQQQIVYHALENACSTHRISSAYLFVGPYGTPKYEAAILLAQSILCEKQDGLACEECNTCRRVKEGLYADLVILDGKENTISKDMVDALQEKFSKTALEANGQRVYIIRNAENATISAQNSMLKFLEEPGEGVTAILTTDNVNRMLDTIVSRCTVLPFMPKSTDAYYTDLLELGVHQEDAYLMSAIVKDKEDVKNMFDVDSKTCTKNFEKVVNMLKQFLNCEGMLRKELSVDWEVSYASSSKDASTQKKENLIVLSAFFDVLIQYAHDIILQNQKGPLWYQQSITTSKDDPIELLHIALQQKDVCNKYNDLNLVFYQTLYQLGGNKW